MHHLSGRWLQKAQQHTVLSCIGIAAILIVLIIIVPLPLSFFQPSSFRSIRIEDRNGALLYEYQPAAKGSRNYLALKDIPPDITQALIATEDRSFYEHGGVSLRGIVRSAVQNAQAGKIVSGGSTITQQLVRNILAPTQRGYIYKIGEALLALKMEQQLSKDDILEEYLNTTYFGHQAYGIASAANAYFGKSVQELSVAESALLVGLLQSPSQYDPFTNMALAKKRQAVVLKSMLDTHIIGADQYADAMSEPLTLRIDAVNIRAPHFVMWLLDQRADDIRTARSVRTTLDLSLQSEVENIVSYHVSELKDKNVTSAAVVVLDAHTGDLLSMVGSADYFDQNHDGAVNVAVSPRQPGSALKPFTYALAITKGDTPATTVPDIETQFFTQEGNPYVPRNYDYGYHGLVRYREALANSYNIAAVRVLEKIGVQTLLSFLRQSGITTLGNTAEHYGLALTLGDGEVELLELAKAYGIFARSGKTLTVRTLLQDPVIDGDRILDPSVAWLISDILSDDTARLPEFGENGPLTFDTMHVAAKTGTTRNSRDNWTIGYTPDRIVGVWVGNADNTPMRGTSGITGAGPIFHDVMIAATRSQPHDWFLKPANIVDRTICMISGKLTTPYCTKQMNEHFIRGTEPKELDTMMQLLRIDNRNGLLAGAGCNEQFVQQRVFTVFPPELRKWAFENGYPQVPTLQSPLCPGTSSDNATSNKELTITSPHDGDSFRIDPLIPLDHQAVILEAATSQNISSIEWTVDGKLIGEGRGVTKKTDWIPTPGKHIITAHAGFIIDRVTIEVIR